MKKLLLLLIALVAGLAAWADDFITDVMLIGGSKNETNTLKTTYTEQGWTVIDQNLNQGAGGDYIFLLYKTASDTVGVNTFITDFLISTASGTVNDSIPSLDLVYYENINYYLVPYDGGSQFKESKGNLNSNAGGTPLHLYYITTEKDDRYRTVKSISFNNIQDGAVPSLDFSQGCNFNEGCNTNTKIYMHTEQSQGWLVFMNTNNSLCYIEGFDGPKAALESIHIPLTVDGATVLNFDKMDFTGFTNLKTMIFSDQTIITEMPSMEGCNTFKNVNYILKIGVIFDLVLNTTPPSIINIPDYAFVGTAVEKLTMTGVTQIGSHAFDGCNLKNATIQQNEIDVSSYAFSNISNKCTISCGGDLTDWDFTNYMYSPNLVVEHVKVGNTWKCGWCGGANADSHNNLYWEIDNLGHMTIDCFNTWVNYPAEQLITSHRWNNSLIKTITLEHVYALQNSEFKGLSNLETVEVNSGLVNVNDSAFYNCGRLKRVKLPSSVKKIGAHAFSGCDPAMDLYFDGTDAQWRAMTRGTAWMADPSLAHWHCTVTFDSNGRGTAPTPQYIEWSNQDKATAPTAPTAPGCVFMGWFTDATCTTLWNFDNEVTGDMTLYAGWKASPAANIEVIEMTAGDVTFNMVKVDGNDDISTFYIGECEVTEALWLAVMGGENPSSYCGNLEDNLPVENISWNDCQTFLTKLNKMTGYTFRLPTTTEWLFAASGGNYAHGFAYCGSNSIDAATWYAGNCNQKQTVGTKTANELGLCDMTGNVYEITHEATKAFGGGWHSPYFHCTVNYGWPIDESFSDDDTGFRLALTNLDVNPVAPGDLNGDGTVDVADLNICINIILELNNDPDATTLADLDGDGSIDISDVNALINIILTN